MNPLSCPAVVATCCMAAEDRDCASRMRVRGFPPCGPEEKMRSLWVVEVSGEDMMGE